MPLEVAVVQPEVVVEVAAEVPEAVAALRAAGAVQRQLAGAARGRLVRLLLAPRMRD